MQDKIARLKYLNNSFDIIENGSYVIWAVSGKKIPYRFVSKRDGDIAEYWADISKAKNELDWSCKSGLDDMIKDKDR